MICVQQYINGCFRNVKDKNFESDSQRSILHSINMLCCFRNVKDKNFESDSQHSRVQ